jgi:tetratricopeptide (TPR) repeat protein
MKRSSSWFAAFALAGLLAIPAFAADPPLSAETKSAETIDAFIAALKANKDIAPEKIASAVEVAEELKADPPSHSALITVALREIYDDYASALVDVADENLTEAIAKLDKLAASPDPYLSTDASFFLARAYMLEEQFEKALPLLNKLQTENSQYSLQQADALFLTGLSQARLLDRKKAIETFTRFEKEFPEAPERMRIGAWRMLQQLQLVEDGTIADVQDRMDFSRRKLALKDPGKQTQEEQQKIVDILAKLIKEAEEKEGQGQGQGKGKGKGREKSGGQGEGEGSGQGQGQDGQTGGHGSGSDNSQNTDVTRLRRTGPESGWSKLRDREREQVFNALKEKYPARYEKLVEQYYKSFEAGGR